MAPSVRSRPLVTAALATALAAPMVLAASPAFASGGGGAVKASGSCSASGVWKLKAKHDNAAIQVEYEVDTNVVGQAFAVVLKDNGTTFFSGTVRTVAPSGSFTVARRTADRAGSDTITARAVRGTNVCGGSVTV